MLHLFDLTECHIQSVRIPSSTCSSASVCVFVLHQIVSQWEKKKIISVRLIWWAVNFRVTTLGLGKVEHRGSFYTIVFDEYAIVAQLYFPIDVTNNFLFFQFVLHTASPHRVPFSMAQRWNTRKQTRHTPAISECLIIRPENNCWKQDLWQQWHSKDRNFYHTTKIWQWSFASRGFHCRPPLSSSCLQTWTDLSNMSVLKVMS